MKGKDSVMICGHGLFAFMEGFLDAEESGDGDQRKSHFNRASAR